MIRFALNPEEKDTIYFKSDVSFDELRTFIEKLDSLIINENSVKEQTSGPKRYYIAHTNASYQKINRLINKYQDELEPISYNDWLSL